MSIDGKTYAREFVFSSYKVLNPRGKTVAENLQSKSGVDYILNSKRPYPEWLRSHTVFKELSRIDKVFPKIGLPNFKEPCDIMNSAEALAEGTRLGSKFVVEMSNAQRLLYTKLDAELKSTAKERGENCAKIQSLINLLNSVIYSLNYADYAKVVEGKVVLRLRADIFAEGKNPVFRKDEAVIRVINKLWDLCEAVKVTMTKTDQYNEFKDFSRVNVPNKKYVIAFSSSGEDGAWDIGTISMRGVTSCQSWNAPQSRGLIGSIASKFVGVMYLASEQEIPGYGSKMLNRSLVRFAIHKTTKKPALILDRMYPNQNNDTIAAFKKVLKEKSGLDVYCTFEGNDYNRNINISTDYYIPDEPSRKFLKQGEFSYMDYAIPVQQHMPSIKKTPANITVLTEEFKKGVFDDLNKGIKIKRELYTAAEKTLEGLRAEYDAAKKKFDEEHAATPEEERPKFEIEEPKMDPALHAFGRGGIMNLLTHCDKKHPNIGAGAVFAKLILDSIVVDKADDCTSKEEYHRKYVMTFLKSPTAIKEIAKKKVATGTWTKSFPRSADRFFESIFAQMRGYIVASCKEMIKKSN